MKKIITICFFIVTLYGCAGVDTIDGNPAHYYEHNKKTGERTQIIELPKNW